MDASLIAENLSKSFSTLKVLDRWNLKIEKSERIVLLGPSGAGKTSFLKMLSGIDSPSSGSLEVFADKIGFVFQEPRLIPWRTVRENLLFVNEDGKIDAVLEKLRLKGFADYYPGQLSGGMQQRVNLARALLLEPDLLILDEAFSSLDLPVKKSIMEDMLMQWQVKRFTILAVTHDLKEALYMADRIIILSSRPSRIVREFTVDLDSCRTFSSPELLALESQLLDIVFQDDAYGISHLSG
jgi:NitT/TauT family transport system ATP-binding protein